MNDWITTSEAAKITGMSIRAVIDAIKRGAIKAEHIGRSYQVYRASAEHYRDNRPRKPRKT